jgi:putative restriction endonuclease
MSLAHLTSAVAVSSAIEEFNRLGRDEFLRKYGFGESRQYFLLVGGRKYDSKAIAGAAHGYQFPKIGPLTPAMFSGGKAGAARRLRELGFQVDDFLTRQK